MFDEAQNASKRRSFRRQRRRLNRRKERIDLLRQLFANEINKIDPYFFERLDDSFLNIDDKRNGNFYNLFNNQYTDYDYFKTYPTIYHLRKHLLSTNEKADIRMLYLAMHHMIKYRGNFLYTGEEFKKQDNSVLKERFNDINDCLLEMKSFYEDEEDYFDLININKDHFFEELANIINDSSSKNTKKASLLTLFEVSKNTLVGECIIPLLVGSKVNISKLTIIKDKNYEKFDLCVSDETFLSSIDDNRTKIKEMDSFFDVLPYVKEIVDHYHLLSLLGNENYLSDSMVSLYDQHQKELKELKIFIKTYLPEKYNECFRETNNENLNNYCKYIGMNKSNKKRQRMGHCKREAFYAYLEKEIFCKISNEEAKDDIEEFRRKIASTNFLLRQNSDQNGSIPMQLNLIELKQILLKQSAYYDFLLEKDDKYTTLEKIILIFKYKIPYYVGPLNPNSEKSWIVRKNDKIFPWNFDEVVDRDETAKAFIQRMQNKCTYLKGENDYCLPKKSLIFSEYNCLQYLNRLNVNGSLISKSLKMDLFNYVFLKIKKPTKKDITSFIKCNYGMEVIDLPEVTFDMSSYIKFKEIFKDEFEKNKDLIEEIIRDITIFEDKSLLERRLKEFYHLDDIKVKQIKDLNYKGYGSLCYNLLNKLESYNPKTGEHSGTIIEILRDTNLNLQQILYDPNYNFIKIIDEYNKKQLNDEQDTGFAEFIENHIYTSPIMKRSLIQAYTIIEEVEKIINQKIDKYYVECTRKEDKKEVTISRYDNIKKLFSYCNELALDFNINLKSLKDKLELCKDKLRSDKIYLYFTQLGKCMYTMEDISFDKLFDNTLYDIDHIYPQSLIKDDSINNRVLVLKSKNNLKTDKFIFELDHFLPNNAFLFYEKLMKMNLITKSKFQRLTKKEITPVELEGFVNRQIVSTNQAVKGLIEVLKLYKHVDAKNIIYSKAKNISDFRNEHELVKSRTANNYHHAHDAYLNVVIGRALNDYYVENYFNGYYDFIKMQNDKKTLNPMQILRYKRIIKSKVIWDKEEMIPLIKQTLYKRFDINETIRTNYSNEMFGKVTIKPAGIGNTISVKGNGPLKNTKIYGGITSYSYSKYIIIKVINRNKVSYILEAIPRMFEERENEYLNNIYENYEIVHSNIKINVVVKDKKMKYCLTGRSGNQYVVKNMKDRNFEFNHLVTIKNIDKYLDNKKNNVSMYIGEDNIIVSPAKSKVNKLIEITSDQLESLYYTILCLYSKDIYEFSNNKNILSVVPSDIKKFKIEDKITVISQLLKLLKTNERSSADLSLFGLSKASGMLYFSKTLKPGLKFISESVTGYYNKILFEVPESGI